MIYPTPADTARALIEHLIGTIEACRHPYCTIAFSGGSTPSLMFDLWADEYQHLTPWHKLRVFWVDERCVPADSPESNYGVMRQHLLSRVPIPSSAIFPIDGDNRPPDEVVRYSTLVRSNLFAADDTPSEPRFDIVLLGVGTDGHTASIFPGQESLLDDPQLYATAVHPQTLRPRITLTGSPITDAEQTIFLVTGADKAAVVADLTTLSGNSPAVQIARRARRIHLFFDAAAANSPAL